MLKATVTVRRALSRSHGDPTDPRFQDTGHRRPADLTATGAATAIDASSAPAAPAGPADPASDSRDRSRRVALRPGWRPAELPTRLAEEPLPVALGPAARQMQRLGMRSLHIGWLAGRPERAERFVSAVVAVFLLVAAVTAAPGLVTQATGATASEAGSVRLVVGGPAGPFGEPVVPQNVVDSGSAAASVTPEPSGGTDGSSPQDAAAAAAQLVQVDGQYLADGTLLKPVAVDPTVEDGRDLLRYYTVKNGDTLAEIAAKFGVSVTTIWNANDIGGITSLHVGQELMIPPVNGKVVTVQPGDSLESVAAANHVDAQLIVSYNGLTDPTLVIGQVLVLPGARLAAVPTPKPTPTPAPTPTPRVRRTSPVTRPPVSYSGGRLLWPVPGGYISQYFHYGHPAIDIAAPYGTPIRAAAAGVVQFAGWKNNGGGYQVWISHGSNLYTTYNHMSSVAVSAGQRVGAGQFIGRVGMTGNATGPHCHFEVWIGPIWNGGYRVNPLGYL